MSKLRQFSIVIHNIRSETKPIVETFVSSLDPVKSVVALEPYPDQDGYHIHIFLKFSNPRGFKSILRTFETFSKSIIAPQPDGEERSWGRVQVDQMRGTFDQATAYLTNPKKDKPVDPNVNLVIAPDPYEEMRRRIGNQHLRRYWGTYLFPDVGLTLMGYQYVELLQSQNRPVHPEWLATYNFINALDT